jgi:hypothetical protein
MKPNAAHTPPAAPASPLIHAKSGLGGAAAAGSTHAAEGSAAAPAAAPAPPASSVMGQVFRRVQRIASVPLLIDTNPLHHTRMIPDGNGKLGAQSKLHSTFCLRCRRVVAAGFAARTSTYLQ